MKDIIFCLIMIVISLYGINLIKVESESYDKRLKNEIEKTKLIIEELKKND